MTRVIAISLTYAVAQLLLSSLFWGLMEYSALAAKADTSQIAFLYDRVLAIYLWAAIANGVILGLFTSLVKFIPVPSHGWAVVLATGTVFIDAVISSLSRMMYPPGIISVIGFLAMWSIYALIYLVPSRQ